MIRTAVIVVPDNEGLRPLFGVPAARRLAVFAQQLGIPSLHFIGKVRPYAPLLQDISPPPRFHEIQDVSSLHHLLEPIGASRDEKVLVMKGSHVIDRKSLGRFIDLGQDHAACFVESEEGRASDGMYLVPPELLESVVRTLWPDGTRAETEETTEAIHRMSPIAGFPGILRGEKDVARGEHMLVEALAVYASPDDGFMARHFDRHISRRMSKRVARTWLLPNHITLMGMSMGLTAAFLLSVGGYWAQLLGSFLFVFCVIVDGVDGEVARLKLEESTFGHYLDIITDNIVHAAIFIGIAYGLHHDTGSRVYLWLLWIMLGGFGLCIVAVYQCILRLSPEEMERSPAAIRVMAFAGNRDFAYLIALLALFGKLSWFLVGASVGSWLFAAALWVISTREQGGRRSPGR